MQKQICKCYISTIYLLSSSVFKPLFTDTLKGIGRIMKEIHTFLVPDYLNSFSCKMGSCRTPCCIGWPVHISLEDYFHLTSRECSEELRHRLDTGVKVSLHPTPEEYAQITPRYDGDCSMRLPDGRCLLHAELGEEALADVCRLYPRGIRLEPDYECSLANSCEGVLELLFLKDSPITFSTQELSFGTLPSYKRNHTFPLMGKEIEIRMWLIRHIQNRALPFPERLMSLGLSLQSLEKVLTKQDAAALDRLLSAPFPTNYNRFETGEDHLNFGLQTLEALCLQLDNRSDSLRTFGEAAQSYFTVSNRQESAGASGDNTLLPCENFVYVGYQHYLSAKEHFETIFPNWEIWFEHMLVNHMFFEQFPFQDRPESPWDEFVAISSLYALLRFLSLGCMADKNSITDFIDMTAAVFRLVEHTSFDHYVARIMHTLGCTTPQSVFNLISL